VGFDHRNRQVDPVRPSPHECVGDYSSPWGRSAHSSPLPRLVNKRGLSSSLTLKLRRLGACALSSPKHSWSTVPKILTLKNTQSVPVAATHSPTKLLDSTTVLRLEVLTWTTVLTDLKFIRSRSCNLPLWYTTVLTDLKCISTKGFECYALCSQPLDSTTVLRLEVLTWTTVLSDLKFIQGVLQKRML
jgi:hypothetical protein